MDIKKSSDKESAFDLLSQMGYFNNSATEEKPCDEDAAKKQTDTSNTQVDNNDADIKEPSVDNSYSDKKDSSHESEKILDSFVNEHKDVIDESESNNPFEATASNEENLSLASDDSEETYDVPDNFFEKEEFIDHSYTEDQVETTEVISPEGPNLYRLFEEGQADAISSEVKAPNNAIGGDKKSTNNILKNTKKRNLSEDDESDNKTFDSKKVLNESGKSNVFLNSEKKYADEKEYDIEIANDIEEESEDDNKNEIDYSQLEGRKVAPVVGKRRKSQRTAEINKKVYNIEQDMSEIDEDDMDYDGYYETVLPYDFGQNKKKFDFKRLLIVLGAVIAMALLFYYMVKKTFNG